MVWKGEKSQCSSSLLSSPLLTGTQPAMEMDFVHFQTKPLVYRITWSLTYGVYLRGIHLLMMQHVMLPSPWVPTTSVLIK